LTVSPVGTPVATLSEASVTLSQAGKVLVLVEGTAAVACGATPCARAIGATLDGTKVRGLAQTVDGPANATTTDTVAAVGIVSNVAAGAHTAAVTSNGAGSNDLRVVAVALGENRSTPALIASLGSEPSRRDDGVHDARGHRLRASRVPPAGARRAG
jgi:hypothetical protein